MKDLKFSSIIFSLFVQCTRTYQQLLRFHIMSSFFHPFHSYIIKYYCFIKHIVWVKFLYFFPSFLFFLAIIRFYACFHTISQVSHQIFLRLRGILVSALKSGDKDCVSENGQSLYVQVRRAYEMCLKLKKLKCV